VKRFWTKATLRESGTPRRSANWLAARRGWFKVFADRLECGDWIITLESIENATLFVGRQLLMRVTVLEVRTAERTYQFGFNPWVRLERHLAFNFEKQAVSIGYSKFSLALRLLLVGYLLFLLVRSFL